MSSLHERRCAVCQKPFVPHAANAHRQVTCGGDCRKVWKGRRNLSDHRDHIPTEGDSVLCPCGERFPREYDRLGRPTSRRLCPDCRTLDSRTRDMLDRPDIPDDAPRCSDCSALSAMVGGLDAEGRCPACARWQVKAAERAARMAAAAGARLPLYLSLRPEVGR